MNEQPDSSPAWQCRQEEAYEQGNKAKAAGLLMNAYTRGGAQ